MAFHKLAFFNSVLSLFLLTIHSQTICPPNETPTNCPPCDPTCTNPRPMCPLMACFVNQVYCKCKTGFVRDANNQCIPPSQCPKTTTIKPCNMLCIQGYECVNGKCVPIPTTTTTPVPQTIIQ